MLVPALCEDDLVWVEPRTKERAAVAVRAAPPL